MTSIVCTPLVPAPDEHVSPLHDRARGALLGLAVGDALGAPAENMKPSEIRARWGRITGYVTDTPAGTDDTEYAIFSGLLLARHGSALTPAHVEAAWHEWIADRAEGPFKGAGFSERGTLENLRRGLAAPISAQHRHAWSDGLAMRAAPFGVFAAGRPAEAARLVAIDGSVSHEGEGIYGGQAVAAGVAAAMAGAPPTAVVAAALAVIPDDSWTARSLRRAVSVAHRGERAVRSAVVIGGYPWTDLAPEAVALAYGAYAAADGDFREAVLTAVNMGRDADTTAAVAGALSGATQGETAIPTAWATAIGPARGSCLPSMAGHHVLEVAELLTGAAGLRPTTPTPAPQPTEPRLSTAASAQPGPRPSTPTSPPTEPHPSTPAHRPPEPHPSTPAHRPAEPHPSTPAHRPPEPHPSTPAHRPPEPHPSTPAHRPPEPHPSTPAHRPPEPHPSTPAHRPAEPYTSTSASPPTEPHPSTPVSPPAEPPPCTPAFQPAEPCPSAPASLPTESGGGWTRDRGSRGRSPLGGACREGLR
ncbi:ADP-ribosylglycohydrolase family protein [Streptomyces sp. NPDC051105]|uniref:ADP-ribosylglycohydrolase family protein n=1 Tax=Streptomyces sp. NPDC051105 TaxID=3154843 RepID=UPI003439CB19